MIKNQSALISIETLREWQSKNNCILLDASIPPIGLAPEKIVKETIPGSIFFDIEKDFSDQTSDLPHTLINEKEFENKVKALGINKDSTIVVFDAYGVYSAPRAWWMFKTMGHEQVFVLNGGLPAWKDSGREIKTTFAEPKTTGNFVASPRKDNLISQQQISSQLQQPTQTIIDARSADRFYGRVEEPRKGLRKGHIPGSLNIPFPTLIDDYFLKPELASDILQKASIKNFAFSCGSGITACIPLLAAYELGYRQLALYDGSWAEWGADESLPVET